MHLLTGEGDDADRDLSHFALKALEHPKSRVTVAGRDPVEHDQWMLMPGNEPRNLGLSAEDFKQCFSKALTPLYRTKAKQGAKDPRTVREMWADPKKMGDEMVRAGTISTANFLCNKVRCACSECGGYHAATERLDTLMAANSQVCIIQQRRREANIQVCSILL